MSESLRELALVEYGASPKEIRVQDATGIKIFGTGGFVGYSRIPLFEEPLVVVARKGTLDKPVFSESPCWVIDTAFAVIPKKNVDAKWLYYQLLNYDLKKLNEATGVPSINRDFLYRVKFNKQPLATQRKIVRILSTSDAVIEKTQNAIAKYKAIKQGMLQDLFTRGIEPGTGKLRPKYQDAPELYKESKLGWIPKEWEVFSLGDVGEFKNGVNKDKNSFGYGTLFVNIIDAYPEILDCSRLSRVNINENEKREYELLNGDIIFVRSSVKPEGVGYNTLFINHNEQVVFCGFMIRYRFNNKNEFKPEFFNSYFRYDGFRRSLIALSTVSANTNINQVALRKLLAIKPNGNEQFEIINRLQSIENKIQTEQAYLHKLQQIKAGLMVDLLSGKKSLNLDSIGLEDCHD